MLANEKGREEERGEREEKGCFLHHIFYNLVEGGKEKTGKGAGRSPYLFLYQYIAKKEEKKRGERRGRWLIHFNLLNAGEKKKRRNERLACISTLRHDRRKKEEET